MVLVSIELLISDQTLACRLIFVVFIGPKLGFPAPRFDAIEDMQRRENGEAIGSENNAAGELWSIWLSGFIDPTWNLLLIKSQR